MPKKKKVTKTRATRSSSSSSMFGKHENLRWLLPLLLLAIIVGLLVLKHHQNDVDTGGDHSAMIKQEIKDKLQMNENESQEHSTASPSYTPSDQ